MSTDIEVEVTEVKKVVNFDLEDFCLRLSSLEDEVEAMKSLLSANNRIYEQEKKYLKNLKTENYEQKEELKRLRRVVDKLTADPDYE